MVGPESFQPEASVKSFRSPLGPGAQRTPAVARRSPPVKIGRPEGENKNFFHRTERSGVRFGGRPQGGPVLREPLSPSWATDKARTLCRVRALSVCG
ncbi:hypothetical protein A3Q41_04972 (plasmid) [Rhodococcoides fascians]|uniref:Uncharacterized protein n=1 Tax=Rhodococcoides fascians TaxID=1828 RepID=A0A143QU73_RHOFA|nr:hypothetical protein A3Q41_04972 [Rhodococcus fascians]